MTEKEDGKQYEELLQELRIALPGVQVLFAFLLTVPFTQRFGEVGGQERIVFFLAVLSTAISSILFIAPTARHRIFWPREDPDKLIRSANRFAIWGSVFLGIALAAATFVVTQELYGFTIASLVAGALAFGIALFWFVMPLIERK